MPIFNLRKQVLFVSLFLYFISIPVFAQISFFSSDIPIIIIETNGLEIHDSTRIIADMGIIDNGDNNRNFLTDPYNGYNGKISIEIRGSTSQSFAKKQYGIETQNEDGSNNNVSLLGLPAENDWILYAPYSDKTLIRNILAYKLSENLGHYAPRTKLVELVLNDEYMGIYVLIEKIKRDNNRINISSLEPDEISGDNLTGGYIIKIDKSTGNYCGGWRTNIADIYFQYEYPECKIIAPEQKQYIIDYINNFETGLFSDNFSDSIFGYRHYIDINSLMDYFFVNELSKNIDAYRLSTFLYKDRDSKGGKLTFGPVWDYNIAFGNANYLDGYETNGLIANRHLWWDRFLQDTVLYNSLKSRWIEIRKNQFSYAQIMNLIDSLVGKLNESQIRNFERWNILGKQVWPNYYVGSSYESEINYLKSWIFNRLIWLDINITGYYQDNQPFTCNESLIFPNPFNSFFTYVFTLNQSGNVTLRLLDLNGRLITNIIPNQYYEEGTHIITWNNIINSYLNNAMYLIILEVDNKVISKNKILKTQ